jgi:hypothetical protein
MSLIDTSAMTCLVIIAVRPNTKSYLFHASIRGESIGGKMTAHDVESRQGWEGDGDEEREDESTEENDNAREEKGTGSHDSGE